MRIAVSGTHVTGKSSLVEAIAASMPGHLNGPEPDEVLEGRGHEFDHPTSMEDFAIQLKQSIATLRRRSPDMILDRCPLDFLGSIYASPGSDRFDLEPCGDPLRPR